MTSARLWSTTYLVVLYRSFVADLGASTSRIFAPGAVACAHNISSVIWEMVHASRYSELAPIMAALIPGLETAVRTADSEQARTEARELLGDTYQAAAAMMVKIGETDAAWIATDRAGFCAERAGSPLAVAAGMFRMAHVFLALGQIDQAHHVATSTAQAPEPKVTPDVQPEVLSL